jgi:hypothetical protein
MIEIQPQHKPFYYIAAAMLGVEMVYFLNLASAPKTGWAVYCSLLALAISLPLLVGACLGFMVGYMGPARNLLLGGLLSGLLWFAFALAALSVFASIVAAFVGLVSYKMLQFHHKDRKGQAQQAAQADSPASGGPAA